MIRTPERAVEPAPRAPAPAAHPPRAAHSPVDPVRGGAGSTGPHTPVPGLTYGQQLQALGNGVVPQQGAHAIRSLMAALTEGAVA